MYLVLSMAVGATEAGGAGAACLCAGLPPQDSQNNSRTSVSGVATRHVVRSALAGGAPTSLQSVEAEAADTLSPRAGSVCGHARRARDGDG